MVFKKNELNSPDATVNKIHQFTNTAQQAKYERNFGKIMPNGFTHLELESGNYCNKETFRKEFKKENFEEFKNKEDLAVEDTIDVFLENYLSAFTEDGWLISKTDTFN